MTWSAALPPEVWRITEEPDGTRRANGPVNLVILPEATSKIFMRNAIQWDSGPKNHQRWLVGELDGVRVYVSGNDILMTKRDLYP